MSKFTIELDERDILKLEALIKELMRSENISTRSPEYNVLKRLFVALLNTGVSNDLPEGRNV